MGENHLNFGGLGGRSGGFMNDDREVRASSLIHDEDNSFSETLK
jgi:hypothetical protein